MSSASTQQATPSIGTLAHNQFDPSRLIVALDVPSANNALALCKELAPLGVMVKVGMQLYYQVGPTLLKDIQALGLPVFVDLKLHDIPNTVAKASESLTRHGAGFFNVHASGGLAMMQAGRNAATQQAKALNIAKPIMIGVTVLTSMDDSQLKHELAVSRSLGDQVVALAKLTQDAGLQGVVCSAQEVPLIRKECGDAFLLVTPGIRLAGADVQDQSRVMTPAKAIEAGSDYLVIGRPITQAISVRESASAILEEMRLAFEAYRQ